LCSGTHAWSSTTGRHRRVLTDPRPEQLGSEAAQSSPQGSNPSEALGRRLLLAPTVAVCPYRSLQPV
jgi:hypothetical protein